MRKNLFLLVAVITVLAMLLAACGTTTEETPAAEEPAAEEVVATEEVAAEPGIGSEEHPIQVLFVPSVDANIITTGGQVMADALHEATGLYFTVVIPTSYAATVEAMCASPTDTIGFIPAQPYVIANQLCGVDVAFKAVRRGWSVYWAEVVVRRDSDIQTLEDLNGRSWAFPDSGSTSGYLFPSVWFAQIGVVPGETIEAGGHPQAVNAVYNGEADFATVFFSPWSAPEGVTAWAPGDNPDVPDDVVESCALTADASAIDCSGYIVNDARANIREEAPDVIQQVRILGLSDPIPNDTLSFGPDFPADVRTQVSDALVAFATTDAWATSIGSPDFYNWTGIDTATDADYDIVRALVESLGITIENFR